MQAASRHGTPSLTSLPKDDEVSREVRPPRRRLYKPLGHSPRTGTDGFLGLKFSNQGSLFRQIFLKHGWVFQKLAKNCKKMGSFPPKFIIKAGSFLKTERQTSSIRKSCTPRAFSMFNMGHEIFSNGVKLSSTLVPRINNDRSSLKQEINIIQKSFSLLTF